MTLMIAIYQSLIICSEAEYADNQRERGETKCKCCCRKAGMHLLQ